jgi:hypothetical protein
MQPAHRSQGRAAISAAAAFDERHKVGLHPHQQPSGVSAVDVSFNERLHLPRLNLDFPANTGDVPLKLTEFRVPWSPPITIASYRTKQELNPLPFEVAASGDTAR